MLTPEQAAQLRAAGLSAYNHNLDTSPEFYGQITTSRKYEVGGLLLFRPFCYFASRMQRLPLPLPTTPADAGHARMAAMQRIWITTEIGTSSLPPRMRPRATLSQGMRSERFFEWFPEW
jgi:hypothetical protein